MVLDEGVVREIEPTRGAADFSFVAEHIQSIFFCLWGRAVTAIHPPTMDCTIHTLHWMRVSCHEVWSCTSICPSLLFAVLLLLLRETTKQQLLDSNSSYKNDFLETGMSTVNLGKLYPPRQMYMTTFRKRV